MCEMFIFMVMVCVLVLFFDVFVVLLMGNNLKFLGLVLNVNSDGVIVNVMLLLLKSLCIVNLDEWLKLMVKQVENDVMYLELCFQSCMGVLYWQCVGMMLLLLESMSRVGLVVGVQMNFGFMLMVGFMLYLNLNRNVVIFVIFCQKC